MPKDAQAHIITAASTEATRAFDHSLFLALGVLPGLRTEVIGVVSFVDADRPSLGLGRHVGQRPAKVSASSQSKPETINWGSCLPETTRSSPRSEARARCSASPPLRLRCSCGGHYAEVVHLRPLCGGGRQRPKVLLRRPLRRAASHLAERRRPHRSTGRTAPPSCRPSRRSPARPGPTPRRCRPKSAEAREADPAAQSSTRRLKRQVRGRSRLRLPAPGTAHPGQ